MSFTQLAESPRVSQILNLVWQMSSDAPDKKVVVASRFVRFLDILEEALAKSAALRGTLIPSTIFTGHIDTNPRVENVRLFNQPNSGPRVLFLSVAAGGTGLNIATASRLIMCKPQYSPSALEKLKARLHRLPQRRVVHVHNVVGRGYAVDQYLAAMLAEKAHVERDLMTAFRRYDNEPLDLPPLERRVSGDGEGYGAGNACEAGKLCYSVFYSPTPCLAI